MSRLERLVHEIRRCLLWQVLLICVGGARFRHEIIDTLIVSMLGEG